MTWLPLLLVLAATFVYAGIAAGSNAYQIKRDFDVSHLWETRERIAAVTGFVALAYAGFHLPHWYGLLAPVAAFVAAGCLFSVRFDRRLNLRRKLDPFYTGTDPQTAQLDKLVGRWRISGRAYHWLKVAGVVVFSAAALLLSGCRTTQAPNSTDLDLQREMQTAQAAQPQPDAGSTPATAPGKRRLLGLLPAKKLASSHEPGKLPYKLPAKLKNSTVIIQVGQGNAAAVTGKKATGPTQATDSSTVNTVAEGANLSNVRGNGNQLKQKAEAPPPPASRKGLSWWWVAAGGAVCVVWWQRRRLLALL